MKENENNLEYDLEPFNCEVLQCYINPITDRYHYVSGCCRVKPVDFLQTQSIDAKHVAEFAADDAFDDPYAQDGFGQEQRLPKGSQLTFSLAIVNLAEFSQEKIRIGPYTFNFSDPKFRGVNYMGPSNWEKPSPLFLKTEPTSPKELAKNTKLIELLVRYILTETVFSDYFDGLACTGFASTRSLERLVNFFKEELIFLLDLLAPHEKFTNLLEQYGVMGLDYFISAFIQRVAGPEKERLRQDLGLEPVPQKKEIKDVVVSVPIIFISSAQPIEESNQVGESGQQKPEIYIMHIPLRATFKWTAPDDKQPYAFRMTQAVLDHPKFSAKQIVEQIELAGEHFRIVKLNNAKTARKVRDKLLQSGIGFCDLTGLSLNLGDLVTQGTEQKTSWPINFNYFLLLAPNSGTSSVQGFLIRDQEAVAQVTALNSLASPGFKLNFLVLCQLLALFEVSTWQVDEDLKISFPKFSVLEYREMVKGLLLKFWNEANALTPQVLRRMIKSITKR